LKQIGMGALQYIQDYDETFPAQYYADGTANPKRWYQVIQPYLKSTQVFICPSDQMDPLPTPPTLPTDGGVSYALNGMSDQKTPFTNDTYTPPCGFWAGAITGDPTTNARYNYDVKLSQAADPAGTFWMADKVSNTNAYLTPGSGFLFASDYLAQLRFLDFGDGGGAMSGFPDDCQNCSRIPPRHLGTANILFVDGHVKAEIPSKFFTWDPTHTYMPSLTLQDD
ncbi:MAG: H-X9-DG-CTERM domain-containing protein, partial [Abditibacteriaceae bacterium]